MEFSANIYGNDPKSLLQSKEEVRNRLDAILSDRVMRFNPYSVDDATLIACAERAVWLPWPALTQMVVFHFHDIRRVEWEHHTYDAIFFHIGNDSQELQLPVSSLTGRITYTAMPREIHVTVNDRALTNKKMVEKMTGNDYFVSHALLARIGLLKHRQAYRMYRLRGTESQKAQTIRLKMIESKITMLQEILAHPYAVQYLCCSRNFIDYTTTIEAAIATIRRFHEVST